ncbi:immunoglobulin superfamily member 5-like isoform X1, partial [Silurus asotus]
LTPTNETVLQNFDATFNCSISSPGWNFMTWTVNGRLVLNILELSGPVPGTSRYSATNYSTAGQGIWGITIKGVTIDDAGQVGCQVLNNLPVFATLTVQQNGTVAITGSNRTATEGDQVTFQCLAANWLPAPEISWDLNGNSVNKMLYNTSSVANGTLMNSNSTLTITAKSNVSVACRASISTLPSPEISTIFLTVQKASRDQTVLIAITVAFSLAALLFLLIYGIIFFCKRRRKKS